MKRVSLRVPRSLGRIRRRRAMAGCGPRSHPPMKIRIIPAILAASLLASCATTTAPDGTVTKAPDATTVSTIGYLTAALVEALFPPPAAPVVAPAK